MKWTKRKKRNRVVQTSLSRTMMIRHGLIGALKFHRCRVLVVYVDGIHYCDLPTKRFTEFVEKRYHDREIRSFSHEGFIDLVDDFRAQDRKKGGAA